MSHTLFHRDETGGVYKEPKIENELIRKMAAEMKTSKIQVEIDHFLVYRKSRVGLFIGSLVTPLLSDGQVFVKAEEKCKVKINFDLIDLQKMKNVRALEFTIKNTCEEKVYSGTFVKQFSAICISDYIYEGSEPFSRSQSF